MLYSQSRNGEDAKAPARTIAEDQSGDEKTDDQHSADDHMGVAMSHGSAAAQRCNKERVGDESSPIHAMFEGTRGCTDP